MKKTMYIKTSKLIVLTVLILTFSACSSVKTYPNDQKKNMTIKTSTNSGSAFRNIKVFMHIYKMDKKCKFDHLGVVELDKPTNKVGLPVNQKLLIEFAFVNATFMNQSSSITREETIITPLRGRFYEVEASYDEGIYDVSIWQKKSSRSKKIKFKNISYDTCKASK